MFLPYKMDSGTKGLPLITVLICLLCTWVYWQQYTKDSQYQKSIHNFCQIYLDAHAYRTLELVNPAISKSNCHEMFDDIRESRNVDEKITQLARQAKPLGIFEKKKDDEAYLYNRVLEYYRNYDVTVPPPLTDALSYHPHEPDIKRMVTATFSHGDIFHLLGNLLFFYIFAAAVELIIGNFMFAIFIAISTVGTQLAYSIVMAQTANALPTIGLSGVVMASIAALATMIPFAQIRCVLWLVFIIRQFKMPAIFLAAWYVGWDIHDMLILSDNSIINYTAHISGAAIGFLFGFYYNLFERERLQLAASHY